MIMISIGGGTGEAYFAKLDINITIILSFFAGQDF